MLKLMQLSAQTRAVETYVRLVEAFALDETNAAEILHPDYVQWELPNLLNKAGQKSDLTETIRRMQVAKKMMASQSFAITSMLEHGETVVMEARWTGKIAADIGAFKQGQELKAFFCMVFEFKDQKIHRIRNYDCFEAF